MPNHVTTILRAPRHVIESLRGPESAVDFNTVIPYPEELDKLTAEYKVFPTQEQADAHQKALEDSHAKYPEFLRKQYEGKVHAISEETYQSLTEKYGPALDWYNWNIANWGTKWNAYEVESDALALVSHVPGAVGTEVEVREAVIIKFETAWSFPAPVIRALSEKFPDEVIQAVYADEDLGSNYGYVAYRGGAEVMGEHEPFGRGGSMPEGLDFAARVKYGQSYAELGWDEED